MVVVFLKFISPHVPCFLSLLGDQYSMERCWETLDHSQFQRLRSENPRFVLQVPPNSSLFLCSGTFILCYHMWHCLR